MPVAFEIKYSLRPRPEKGFWYAMDDLDCDRGFVVYPGEEFYPLGKGVYALPVKEIENILNDLM